VDVFLGHSVDTVPPIRIVFLSCSHRWA